MLATNAELKVGAGRAAARSGDRHELADAFGVQGHERIGRATRADLKLGVCGEHGGDPASIAFCEQAGLDYVSCSPFRIPIARLAAAQAALGRKAASTA